MTPEAPEVQYLPDRKLGLPYPAPPGILGIKIDQFGSVVAASQSYKDFFQASSVKENGLPIKDLLGAPSAYERFARAFDKPSIENAFIEITATTDDGKLPVYEFINPNDSRDKRYFQPYAYRQEEKGSTIIHMMDATEITKLRLENARLTHRETYLRLISDQLDHDVAPIYAAISHIELKIQPRGGASGTEQMKKNVPEVLYLARTADIMSTVKRGLYDLMENRLKLENYNLGNLDKDNGLAFFQQDIKDSGIQLKFNNLPKLENNMIISAHKGFLISIMNNLIKNARKYHDYNKPEGERFIEISYLSDPEKNNLSTELQDYQVIVVSDNGLPIPNNIRESIFDYGNRGIVEKSNIPGTGIGLTLVKVMAEGMGGRVWVEDGLVEGATKSFVIALPKA